MTLVGCDRARLDKVKTDFGQGDPVKVVVADTSASMAALIARERPTVVFNAMGSFAETAVPIAHACMPGGHYVDLAADLVAIPKLLALDGAARAGGSTLVTGAGFGVLATEAVVARLCEARPTPSHVRVDTLPSVSTEAGVVGEAFAAAMVDLITTGGRRYHSGRLVKARLGSNVQVHRLPDNQAMKSEGAPAGELVAAHRISGAPNVTVTTSLAPTSPITRAAVPVLAALLSIPSLRQLAVCQMAKTTLKAAPRPRTHSWGHAALTWADGTSREGWLRTDDGMDFTADVAAETAARLARGEGKPGAYTPAAAFGADLATAAGGVFIRG
ncbi:hypothetical protein [Mycolicibacterium peregrinum]|uniref:hypothetical protein n=1 Tax=Mycolicibacterium peregrinum TaxID=43304 RepID=UPI000A739F8E|nr:hypothetical protein [Mycolicibacterium peregrinum]